MSREDIIAEGRAKWGEGFEFFVDTETREPKRVFDGRGMAVPREDWDAFFTYQRAVQDHRKELIEEYPWRIP